MKRSRYEDQELVTVRKRGRHPLADDEPSTVLSVRLPVSTFDRLCMDAKDRRIDLSAYVRSLLPSNS